VERSLAITSEAMGMLTKQQPDLKVESAPLQRQHSVFFDF